MTTPDPSGPSGTLEGWRELEKAATPGPWEAHSHLRQYSIWHDELDEPLAREVRNWDDAMFIAAARSAYPRLVAALEAVLKLADDWERQAMRLATAAGDTGHAILAEQRAARSGTLRNCARELRHDITGTLAGESRG